MKKFFLFVILSLAFLSTSAFAATTWENALVNEVSLDIDGNMSFLFSVPGKKGLSESERSDAFIAVASLENSVANAEIREKIYTALYDAFTNRNEVTVVVDETVINVQVGPAIKKVTTFRLYSVVVKAKPQATAAEPETAKETQSAEEPTAKSEPTLVPDSRTEDEESDAYLLRRWREVGNHKYGRIVSKEITHEDMIFMMTHDIQYLMDLDRRSSGYHDENEVGPDAK